jgi:hypothetical protein
MISNVNPALGDHLLVSLPGWLRRVQGSSMVDIMPLEQDRRLSSPPRRG